MILWFCDRAHSAEPVEIGVVMAESGTDMGWALSNYSLWMDSQGMKEVCETILPAYLQDCSVFPRAALSALVSFQYNHPITKSDA